MKHMGNDERNRIPQDQVTLHPFLLGRKFQKAADKAALRKNGVSEQNSTGFARSYRINLRLLPELAFSSGHDALFQEGRVESVECKV